MAPITQQFSTRWFKVACNMKLPNSGFICEKHNDGPMTTFPTTDPTEATPGDRTAVPHHNTSPTTKPLVLYSAKVGYQPQWNYSCSDTGWTLLGNTCYKLITEKITGNNATSKTDATEARKQCHQHDGILVDSYLVNGSIINTLFRMWKFEASYGSVMVMNKNSTCYAYSSTNDESLEVEDSGDTLWTLGVIDCAVKDFRHTLCSASASWRRYSEPQCHHNQFTCADGRCIKMDHICDKTDHCADGSDERTEICNWNISWSSNMLYHLTSNVLGQLRLYNPGSNQMHDSNLQYFRCDNSSLTSSLILQWEYVCDGKEDCGDGSDENYCYNTSQCLTHQCKSGECISNHKICNGVRNCLLMDNEEGVEICSNHYINLDYACDNDICVGLRSFNFSLSVANINKHVSLCAEYGRINQISGLSPCPYSSPGCFPRHKACILDYAATGMKTFCEEDKGQLKDCEDFECPGYFKCQSGVCLPLRLLCDGTPHCNTADDEQVCDQPDFCKGNFWCGNMCLSQSEVCDGILQCKDGQDEQFCDFTCPKYCVCLGYLADCTGHPYLHLTQSLSVRQVVIVARKGKLKFLNNITKYVHLMMLDASSNDIDNILPFTFQLNVHLQALSLASNKITTLGGYVFNGLISLRYLNVQGNAIASIEVCGLCGMPSLPYLNLSHINIERISEQAFSRVERHGNKDKNCSKNETCKLKWIDLSYNKLQRLRSKLFEWMDDLQTLNLQHNTLDVIDADIFHKINSLSILHTDAFKFCCLVNHKKVSCTPKADQFSNCDDLMSNTTLRIFIWILSFVALVGNLAVIIWRGRVEKLTPLSFLVRNLGIADLMMGIYLMIIAGADANYRGTYILYEQKWKESYICRVAGILSMLSSEMSVFILVLITTDRVLVVGLCRNGISEKAVKVVVIVGWAFFCLLSIIPVVNLGYFGSDNYIRHGVCFLFNLTEGKVAGWEYATAIFIVFNLLALVYLTVGYSFMFINVICHTGVRGDAEMVIARKLVLVVMTDCLCWIPPIVVGIMSLSGYSIDPVAAMWIAVFVFPVNSSLNPFLYTFSYASICKSPDSSPSSNDSNYKTRVADHQDVDEDDDNEEEDYEVVVNPSKNSSIKRRASVKVATTRGDDVIEIEAQVEISVCVNLTSNKRDMPSRGSEAVGSDKDVDTLDKTKEMSTPIKLAPIGCLGPMAPECAPVVVGSDKDVDSVGKTRETSILVSAVYIEPQQAEYAPTIGYVSSIPNKEPQNVHVIPMGIGTSGEEEKVQEGEDELRTEYNDITTTTM